MSVQDSRAARHRSGIDRAQGRHAHLSLTAYTTPMARQLDPHVDMLLVGDSLGMVLYGMESTLPVTLDMMIAHGQAVMRGSRKPASSSTCHSAATRNCPKQAFRTAARVMAETGCGAVKLEGGAEMAETVHFLVERGIPVLGHVGLTPQSVNPWAATARWAAAERKATIASGRQGYRGGRRFCDRGRGHRESLARQLTGVFRFRLSASARHRPATARSWSPRTWSACSAISSRNSSSVMPNSAPNPKPPGLCRRCARAPLPRHRACLRAEAEREHPESLRTCRSSARSSTFAPACPLAGGRGQSRPGADHGRAARWPSEPCGSGARQGAKRVMVSVFVNPTQFGPNEDSDYPRDEAADAAKLATVGADLLYAPDVGEIYPDGFSPPSRWLV